MIKLRALRGLRGEIGFCLSRCFIRISNPDLPDASSPTAGGGSVLPAAFQNYNPAAAKS
jgi:hypothetical protein